MRARARGFNTDKAPGEFVPLFAHVNASICERFWPLYHLLKVRPIVLHTRSPCIGMIMDSKCNNNRLRRRFCVFRNAIRERWKSPTVGIRRSKQLKRHGGAFSVSADGNQLRRAKQNMARELCNHRTKSAPFGQVCVRGIAFTVRHDALVANKYKRGRVPRHSTYTQSLSSHRAMTRFVRALDWLRVDDDAPRRHINSGHLSRIIRARDFALARSTENSPGHNWIDVGAISRASSKENRWSLRENKTFCIAKIYTFRARKWW